MSLRTELETALAIGAEAATVVRGFWRGPIRIEHKEGNEPVTDADHAANDIIVARLRRAFPSDAVLSEELPDDGSRLGAARVWMVDPIDGTRDFIAGAEGFAVMIGLCIEGRPAVGVVCQPSTGIVWAGAQGEGAFRQDRDGTRTPLIPSTLSAPPGIRLVSSKSNHSDDLSPFRQLLQIVDEINVGGVGLKIGLVADNSRDAYVYTGRRTKLWDACAPEAILATAGGRVTDTTGAPLNYSGADLMNPRGIVATNGPLHPAVLAALRGRH